MKADHEQIEALLNRALEFKPTERPAFLAGACAGNQELREKVETLLRASDDAQGFMEGITTLEETRLSEGPGSTIGRYKLLQKVGEGGMGVVYMAEQTEPVVRKVALKIIKLGMDTKQVVARFEAERQALAMMDHPNIAKVLDAGSTDSGRPYFVMELVRGVPITEYCDKNQLGTQERLNLFIPVCQAIQHAHQKGVIHRDIKPSNVMVTLHDGNAVPKVIDFGIAKATTDQRLTDKTLFTALEQFMGTPAYMSPEQAEMSGLDIDTRSDIYSLGVLLYELLAGSTPFDVKELMASGINAMRATIREKEPVRPSTRVATLGADQLTTTAKRRSTDTSKLFHQLKGDLDWIVMKCLEKDRQHRYDTANGLAADLKRHLDNEPVHARPPSPAYKFQKAFRRNKLIFSAGGIVVVGLLIGLAALAFALVRERALKSESARADSIATFVTGMLNEVVPQLVQQGNSTGVRVLLDAADRLVSTTLTNSPAAELTVRNTLLGFYYGRFQDFKSARKQTDRIEFLLSLVPDDRLPPNCSRDVIRINVAMGRLCSGSISQGRAELEKLAEELKRRGPEGNPSLALNLAYLGIGFLSLNNPLEAEPLAAEAYRLLPEPDLGAFYTMVLILNGEYRMAEEAARTSVSRLNAKHGVSPEDLASYALLVEILCRLGRSHEAETLLGEQLGPGAAQPWTPAHLRRFEMLQLAVQAFSGKWREAVPGLIAQATNSLADVGDWSRGVTAALAAGDTNAYVSLGRLGRTRFAGNAEAETAISLFLGLILHPKEEDLSLTLPDLLRRVEEGKDYHWSAPNIPLLNSQLAYRKGAYEEALLSLDTWAKSSDDRPHNAIMLSFLRGSALPNFWRAMILARLGRPEGSVEAYAEGAQKLRAGFPRNWDFFNSLTTFYASHALRQEAQEVLRSQGISVPDPETTP